MVRKASRLAPPFLKRICFEKQPEHNEDFPFTLPIFKKSFDLSITHPVTILVGENGTGKSTLLEYLAFICGFNLQGGSSDHIYESKSREDFSHLSALKTSIRLAWLPKISQGFFMRAETFYNFLEYIYDPQFRDIDYQKNYGGNLLEKSHGEAFLSLFSHRFQRSGIYFLDEPEAALSPNRQLAFLKIIAQMERRGDTQIVMITHSPILMSYPGAQMLLFSQNGINSCVLEEVENYCLMREFLKDPQSFLKDIKSTC